MITGFIYALCLFQVEKETIHPDFQRYFKSSPVLKQSPGGKIIQIPEGFVLLGIASFSISDKGASELVQAEEAALKKARASLVGTKGIRVYSVTRIEDESTVKIEDEKSSENSYSKLVSVNEEVITGQVAGSEVIGRWLSADGAERFVAVGVKLNKKGEKLPYLADFLVTLKEVLEGGKSEATRAMVEQMDQSWRTRLVSACEISLKEGSSLKRAAAISALGWGLARWNDGEELFIKSLQDSEAIVCKAGIDTFQGATQPKVERVRALIKLASERKDSVREAAMEVIGRIRPESIDLIDLYFETAHVEDPQIVSICVASLENRNIGHKRRMELARHLIKGKDRPNRLSGLKMLASQKEDDRQAVLDGLLTEVGGVDSATSQMAATFVESFIPLLGEDRTTLGKHLSQGRLASRLLAAQLVASMGPQGASLVPVISQMLSESDQRLVVMALSTLGKIAIPSLVPMERIKEKAVSESQEIRLAAVHAMSDLGPQSGLQAQLVEALGDSSRIIARAASRGLAKYSPAFSRENCRILGKYLSHKSPIVKRYAYRTLADLSPVDSVLSNQAVAGLFDADALIQLEALRICTLSEMTDRGLILRVSKILGELLEGRAGLSRKPQEGITADQVTMESAPSIAFISAGKAEAMGCLVGPRLVISNKSVCGMLGQVAYISFPGSPVFSGRQLKGKTIKLHPDLDIGLIELESNPAISALPLSSSAPEGEKTSLVSIEFAGDFSVGVKVFSQNAKMEGKEGAILKILLAVPSQMGGCVLIGVDGTVRGLKASGTARSGNQWDFIGSPAISEWLGNGIEIGNEQGRKIISEQLETEEISPDRLASAALGYLSKAGTAAGPAKTTLIDCLKSPKMAPVRKEAYKAIAALKAEGVSLVNDLLDLTSNPMARGNPTFEQFKDFFLSSGDNLQLCDTLAALGAPAARKISEGLLRRQPEAKFMALLAIEKMGADGKDAKALVYRSSLQLNEKNLYIRAQALHTYDKLERASKSR